MLAAQKELLDVGRIAPRSRVEWLIAIAERMHYDIRLADGCVEPGYDDKPVAMADWNSKTKYNHETREHKIIDDTMTRLSKLFEKLGYSIEWEDEWEVCENCGKTFRTQPDSYSWKPSYWMADCFCLCHECVKKDPADYIESFVGVETNAITLDIDLSEHGFHLHKGGLESGWHEGQDDNPKTIAKGLRSSGIEDFVFVLDSNGQFDIGFSVWVRDEEEGED
jgi:hypothetical protein